MSRIMGTNDIELTLKRKIDEILSQYTFISEKAKIQLGKDILGLAKQVAREVVEDCREEG